MDKQNKKDTDRNSNSSALHKVVRRVRIGMKVTIKDNLI